MTIVDYLVDRLVEDAVTDAFANGQVVPVVMLADEIVSVAGCTSRRAELIDRLTLLCAKRGLPIELRRSPSAAPQTGAML